jgi:hypothetical protein
MKKLTLDLDALSVDSFDIADVKGEGTVLANWGMMATRTDACRTPCCPDTYQPGCTG